MLGPVVGVLGSSEWRSVGVSAIIEVVVAFVVLEVSCGAGVVASRRFLIPSCFTTGTFVVHRAPLFARDGVSEREHLISKPLSMRCAQFLQYMGCRYGCFFSHRQYYFVGTECLVHNGPREICKLSNRIIEFRAAILEWLRRASVSTCISI